MLLVCTHAWHASFVLVIMARIASSQAHLPDAGDLARQLQSQNMVLVSGLAAAYFSAVCIPPSWCTGSPASRRQADPKKPSTLQAVPKHNTCPHAPLCSLGALATLRGLQSGANTHSQANSGTIFLMSSDLFTFSGLVNAQDGIPALRTWAITQTDRISQVPARDTCAYMHGTSPQGMPAVPGSDWAILLHCPQVT